MISGLNYNQDHLKLKNMSCCMAIPLVLAGKFIATKVSIFVNHLVEDYGLHETMSDMNFVVNDRLRHRRPLQGNQMNNSYNYDAIFDRAYIIERMLNDDIDFKLETVTTSSDDFNTSMEEVLGDSAEKLPSVPVIFLDDIEAAVNESLKDSYKLHDVEGFELL